MVPHSQPAHLVESLLYLHALQEVKVKLMRLELKLLTQQAPAADTKTCVTKKLAGKGKHNIAGNHPPG
jgi:hypothetical protein